MHVSSAGKVKIKFRKRIVPFLSLSLSREKNVNCKIVDSRLIDGPSKDLQLYSQDFAWGKGGSARGCIISPLSGSVYVRKNYGIARFPARARREWPRDDVTSSRPPLSLTFPAKLGEIFIPPY